jgi:hypothetical protein
MRDDESRFNFGDVFAGPRRPRRPPTIVVPKDVPTVTMYAADGTPVEVERCSRAIGVAIERGLLPNKPRRSRQ